MNIKRLGSNDADLAFIAIKNIKLRDDESTQSNLSQEYLIEFLSNNRHYLFAALNNEEVIGFLLAYRLQRVDRNQDSMYFYEIEVNKEYRNRGIGSKLIDELKAVCRNENIMKMWVSTNRSNIPAMSMYAKTGGKENVSGEEVSFTYYPPFE